MTAPAGVESERSAELPESGPLGVLQAVIDRINAALVALSAVAAAVAGCVLTWEVAGRYFFKIASDWQDELSVFLLVGATFGSIGWITMVLLPALAKISR